MSYMSHYPSPHERGNQDVEDWEQGGSASYPGVNNSLVYTAASPNVTISQHWPQVVASASPSMSYTGYHQTSQAALASSYGYASTLPLPHSSNMYGRGLGSNPASYHYSHSPPHQAYYHGSYTTGSDGTSLTGLAMASEYPAPGSSYPYGENSSPPASESSDGVHSLESENGNPGPSSDNKKSSSKDKKWVCNRVNDATSATCYRGFARKADLQRHEQCVHDKHKQPRIDCGFKKCARKGDNGFLRRDHLTEHLRNYHNQDIPKRSRRNSSINADEGDDEYDDGMDHGVPQQQQYPY